MGSSGLALAFPLAFGGPGSLDARDLYKSIILRNNMRSVFTRDRESILAKLLAAIGESDNQIGGLFGTANFYGTTAVPWNGQYESAIDQAHDSMLLDTAEGKFLTAVGGNNGVPRPPQSPFDDVLYRSIVPILSWLPKTPILVAYRLAEVLFGTQASLGKHAWQFYEVNPNEIIFEYEGATIVVSNANASYMHGYRGTAIGSGSTTVTVVDTDASLAATSLVGLSAYLFYGGVWNTTTIASQSYNAGTSTNTFVLSASVPAGDSKFFIDIPSSVSFDGDYMLADASQVAGGTNPDSTRLVYLYGRGVVDIFQFYMDNFVRAAGVVLNVVEL